VARDAIARQYDVDANLTVLDKKVGKITFQAKKGKLVDLDKLHESIWATRLGDNTGMALKWMEVTTHGEVAVVDKQSVLKVHDSAEYFVLKENPKTQSKPGEKTAFHKLLEALERGDKVVSVTGTLEGWQGNLTQFTKKSPAKPRAILVQDFQIGK
jgi:hypothetical protein